MSALEISKALCREHRTIRKAVKNISKLRIRNKLEVFVTLRPRDEHNLKRVLLKHSHVISTQITYKP